MTYMGPVPGAGAQPEPQGRHHRHGYRSLFWAIVFIAAGVVWLLSNLGVLTTANLAVLSLLWPLLLVGIGVDLLLGRRSLVTGALVGVVTVGLIIVLMLVGPGQGWGGSTEVKTQTNDVSVGQTTSASVELDTGGYSASVHGLPVGSGTDRPLVTATVSYTRSYSFGSSGLPLTTVTLAAQGRRWWTWFHTSDLKPWDIGIDPTVPLSLKVNSASGSVNLDLSTLQLADLEADVSSGDTKVNLPARGGQAYGARLQLSSGDLGVQAAPGANVDMTVDMSSGDASVALGQDSDVRLAFSGSSGDFRLQLAPGQAYRVEVKRISSGDVHKPSGLVQVTQGNGKQGVWETQGYGSAAHKVLVTVEMSSGSVTLKQ